MADNFNPPGTQTLGPDDPLRAWLDDPAMADFVRQKAIEHAQNVLGYAPTESSMLQGEQDVPNAAPAPPSVAAAPAAPVPPLPTAVPPTSIFGRLGIGQGRTAAPAPAPATVPGVIRSDPEAYTRWQKENPVTPFDPTEPPVLPTAVPVPAERPIAAGPGASDVSASAKKKPELGDALGDFSKSLAGVKPLPPPPLNPVGTPSVRSPTASGAPNLAALLQYMGQQAQPNVLSTLGRLLVAGKA